MTGYEDPAVQRHRLRVELRKARLDAGKTQRDVAEAMDWSVSKLIRIENGDVRISKNDLRALLEHYGITERGRIDSLLQAARVARELSWSDYRGVHPPAFLDYLGFESSALIIRNYEPFFVSGLLQTEEYAWAIQIEVFGDSPQIAERRWRVRQQRQRLHDRELPPQMFFILDEAVIRRPVGGPSVMRRQLQRLRDWSTKPHTSLQVFPFEYGAYVGMGTPFFLLEFQDPREENVLFLEHSTAGTNPENPEETGLYLTRFLELEKVALSLADTQRLLDQLISEMNATMRDTSGGRTREGKRRRPLH
jgi:transcriptional regulator with XRE-family HTH domain